MRVQFCLHEALTSLVSLAICLLKAKFRDWFDIDLSCNLEESTELSCKSRKSGDINIPLFRLESSK